MTGDKKGLKQRMVDFAYVVAYYSSRVGLRLSKLPVIGKPFEFMADKDRLKIVTVPVNVRLQDKSAILPYEGVKLLVENASYVAARNTCMCRESRGCHDYPKDHGCIYLGEGARTIKYDAKEITKAEAMERLERSRSLGLVLNIVWSTDEFGLLGANPEKTIEVCSCCPCCCLLFKTRDASRAYMDNILAFGTCKAIDASRCTGCMECAQACPFDAIHVLEGEGPAIDVARCKGCGRCVAACKMDVLEVSPQDNDISTKQAQEYMGRFMEMVR